MEPTVVKCKLLMRHIILEQSLSNLKHCKNWSYPLAN
uniref:Uncharacterized protein n=1 Tax=Setaria italica TaxID=4555 RepID=K3XTN3_SETIT